MTEAQKYQKKKNALIVTFMILLLVFVCFICYIFIYVKQHPKKEFVSSDTIEIVKMQTKELEQKDEIIYVEVTEATDFVVLSEEKEKRLILNDNKEIIDSENSQKVKILLNDIDINNNIKMIYQNELGSLILSEDGKLYKLVNKNMTNASLNAGQILTNMEVKNIVTLEVKADSIYVLLNDNKLINVNTQEEYNRIIKTLETPSGNIYIYDNNGIALEEGKLFVDSEGNLIKLNIFFENKLIDEKSVIYEVDFINKEISTSKLGVMKQVGYGKLENEPYSIRVEANTGYYDFKSEYYYTR